MITVVIGAILAATDNPFFFRYRSLRFLYGFGLPLYFRMFKVLPRSDKFSIPRWKIEHWMAASGFSKPMAEGNDGQYVLMEFVGLPGRPIPLLMRAKISWDNKDRNVIVWGYATWTYFIIFAALLAMFFIPAKMEGDVCLQAPMFVYLLWCGILYFKQSQRLPSIGEQISQYLSSDYQEYRTQR
ncbi:MAG: hypothetical protein HY865_21705 [Chloroflexi bacterium]|nr:hypothetical protein [Chloroflexota bacterium]